MRGASESPALVSPKLDPEGIKKFPMVVFCVEPDCEGNPGYRTIFEPDLF